MIVKRQASAKAAARSAFTLMEILVVVAIIVMLAGASMAVLGYLESSKVKAAKMGCINLEKAVMAYKMEYGSFPTSLQALTQADQSTGLASVDQKALLDPWGQAYVLDTNNTSPTGAPHIYSNGPPNHPKQISNLDR